MPFESEQSASVLALWRDALLRAASAGVVSHPIDPSASVPALNGQPDDRRSQLEESWNALLAKHDGDPSRQLLEVWRNLRDSLAAQNPGWAYLEAEGRPGITVWDQLDTIARGDENDLAFLSFSLGPVQSFIAASRSARDLWTGSYILAYLAFQAMVPVLEAHGPSALVFPSPRGMPLIDGWLEQQGVKSPSHSEEARLTPCLPNRFLAVVAAGENGDQAHALAKLCEEFCHESWFNLARQVRNTLDSIIQRFDHNADWDRFWSAQIETYFEVRSAVLPWSESHAAALKAAIPHASPNDGDPATLYAPRLALQFGLLEASRSVRHVPDYNASLVAHAPHYPQKCSLLGTHEQMGPAILEDSRAFWSDFAAKDGGIKGTRVREGERLGAVSLTKRFAWPAALNAELNLDATARRFADTATIAAREWLDEAGIDPDDIRRKHKNWSGQWLFRDDDDEEAPPDGVKKLIRAKSRPKPDGVGPPPAYYAALALDGDHMGRWIQGRMLPKGRSFGPETHNAISAALNHYALLAAPTIVEKHHGELIYAGGDDVLALFPTSPAIACADALRLAFGAESIDGKPSRYTLGPRAGMSGGLVVAHYKEDLRFVLDETRTAEKLAKASGRNALALRVLKRSGEHSTVVIPWEALGHLTQLVSHFKDGATNRWSYALRAELPTLRGLPREAVLAEALRLVNRVEEEKHKEAFVAWVNESANALLDLLEGRGRELPEAIDDLVILCQSASFLARGRDD